MNSRDRLRDGELRRRMEDELIEVIKNHSMLKELRERRRREDLQSKIQDDKPLTDMIDNILKKSPTLSQIFLKGERLSNPLNLHEVGEQKQFEGKFFPTFFQIKGRKKDKFVKRVPKNVRTRVNFETDAENEYFDRDNQPGKEQLNLNGEIAENYNLNLHNGIATVNIRIPEEAIIGQELNYTLIVDDETRFEPFVEEFTIIVEEEQKYKNKGVKGKRKKGRGNGDDAREDESRLALPNVIEIRKDEWEKHNLTDESALKVVNNGDSGFDFYINLDNIHLLTEKKSKSLQGASIIENRYKYGMVLLGLGVINHLNSEDTDEDPSVKAEEFTKMVSPMLIPMIESLGNLQEDE
ncbi:hypothetical protein SAMN04488072_1232 [Lentibacillus halodurans]|uniref:Uncharacterized protein n=1 Tax=Lentibacillus halodurans TaxID=237679 RepID=A0A1I1APZ9_9BACI|nr:hypothetical protein [Lentibacillus halodurans]SFB38423.1 hypothetical protein SAMN04488072_1232 [Lentibacillus halodurans]